MWRVVTHPRMNTTLAEMEEHWCMDECLDAHMLMDMFDELDSRPPPAAPAKARSRKTR